MSWPGAQDLLTLVCVCGLPGGISHTTGRHCLDYVKKKNKCTLSVVGHGDAGEISFKTWELLYIY